MKYSIAGALLLAACGDPLTAGDYRGEPLFKVEGLVMDYQSSQAERDQLTASVFWSVNGKTSARGTELVEEPFVSVEVNFLNVFHINLFHPPPLPELYENERGYALGLILVAQDGELRGGADLNVLLYAGQEIPAERSPTKHVLNAGYSLVDLPLPCDGAQLQFQAGTEECGVPMGAACATNADCGEHGECLTYFELFGETFPGGYCAMPNIPGGCTPKNGVLGPDLQIGPDQFMPSPYWFDACSTNEDCRQGENYRCDIGMGACWPRWPAAIVIAPQFEVAPLCIGDWQIGP